MIHGLILQLNEAGKIKIGRKGKMTTSSEGNEFRLPEKLDHFQLVTTEKNTDGDFIIDTVLENRIKEAGTGIVNEAGNLTGIPIRLLYNDTELNFPTKLSSYVKGKLSCTGDGQKATKRVDDFKIEHPCPCARSEQGYNGKDKCKPMGTLTCIIDEAGLFGQAHKFRTTSMNSVKGILGGLEIIKAATSNRIAGLPLMLTMNPKSTTTPQGANTIVYVVSLCYRGTMSDMRSEVLQIMNEERQYLIGMDKLEAEARKTQSHNIASEEEQLEVAEEFYPDSIEISTDPDDFNKEPIKKEDEEKIEEIENSLPGDPPVGTYKDLYDRLCKETEYEKAVSFAKRLTKNNLIYYLTQYHPSVEFDIDTIKKPELIELCEEALACLVGEVITTPVDEWESHSEYIRLNAIEDRKEFLDAVSAFFRPQPIDRTRTRDELLKAVKKELQSVFAKEAIRKTEIKPEEKQLTTESTIAEKQQQPNTSTSTITLAWDDESGLIEKDQLINLVNLKKILEVSGIIDVTKPEMWTNGFVGQFTDSSGVAHKTATKMSKKQGDTLIKIIEDKISETEIPF